MSIEDEIRNIEKGLVGFTTPMDVFQASGAKVSTSQTLTERMAFYHVPGVAIAVVKNYEIAWSKAYGVQSIESNLPITSETLFEAASSTKLFAAVIALHLVEDGQIGLDDDVNNFLKSWKIPESELIQDEKVTLRLLLTHQAGINPPEGGFSWEDGSVPSLVQILNGETPAKNHPVKLEFIPGSKWQYSNLGYVLIQLLIEDLLGKSFQEIAQEIIFQPLQMKFSTLMDSDNEKFPQNLNRAMPHDAQGVVHQQKMVPTAVAHGGLLTTPLEFSIFLIELMKSSRGLSNLIVSREMAEKLFHPLLDLNPNILGVPLGQGLGVFLYSQGRNHLFLHPGGNFPGANCWPIGAPDLGNATVIMTNGANGELLGMEIISAIMKEYCWLKSSQGSNQNKS